MEQPLVSIPYYRKSDCFSQSVSLFVPDAKSLVRIVGDDADAVADAQGHDLLVVHRPGVDADPGGQGAFDHAGVQEGAPMGMNVLGTDGLGVLPGLVEAVAVEDAVLHIRLDPAKLHEGIMVEGGIEDASLHALLLLQLQHLLGDAGIDDLIRLDLHVDHMAGVADEVV